LPAHVREYAIHSRDCITPRPKFLISAQTRTASLESKMLIHFSNLVLASHLLMTVTDNVPQFNIERGCRADNTNTSGLSVGMDESTKGCIHDEQAARDQLQAQWSQFAPSDRAMCTANETDVPGAPPSYVDLLTCLQGAQLAKKMKD
jgi:hypothetical protein